MFKRIANRTNKTPLPRLALVTAAAVCTLGLTTALAEPEHTGPDLDGPGFGRPCTPEISNWLFGVPVIAMLGVQALRRKTPRNPQKPMVDRHCMGE